jgi:hypothetical protein
VEDVMYGGRLDMDIQEKLKWKKDYYDIAFKVMCNKNLKTGKTSH